MAQQNQGTHNSPSQESPMKGAQPSQQGNTSKQKPQSHEASVKGGEHSHSGSGSK